MKSAAARESWMPSSVVGNGTTRSAEGDRDDNQEDQQLEREHRDVPEVEVGALELAEGAGGRHAEMMHDLDVQPWAARIEQGGARHRAGDRYKRETATPLDAVAEQP